MGAYFLAFARENINGVQNELIGGAKFIQVMLVLYGSGNQMSHPVAYVGFRFRGGTLKEGKK